MRIPNRALWVLGLIASTAILAACSAGNSQSGFSAAAPTTTALEAIRLTTSSGFVPPFHPNHRKSWTSFRPDRKTKTPLLYVSDTFGGAVEVYNYKTHALTGEATGLMEPYGECSDKRGDVYVADFLAGTVVEFPYGSTTPSRTIAGLDHPIGCSVNPKNGDLAVSQYFGGLDNTGSVLIFAGAKGAPAAYNFTPFTWPPGYDKNGNLYASGKDPSFSAECYTPCLEELPLGGSSFGHVSFDQTLFFPGAVEWDGQYLGVSDQEAGSAEVTKIYRLSCSGNACSTKETVTLTDTCNNEKTSVVQWAEYSKKPNLQSRKTVTAILSGNNACPGTYDDWKYPDGGNPIKEFSGPAAAWGQTIVK